MPLLKIKISLLQYRVFPKEAALVSEGCGESVVRSCSTSVAKLVKGVSQNKGE
jgi:hypothetical protein